MAKNGPAPGRTAKGTFAVGNPGNKTGRTAVPAHLKSGLKRSDGWSNFFTGQGVIGQDKRSGGFFKADILTFDQMMELAIGDDIAKRACNTIPNEALRQGWDLVISEGASNKIDIAPKGPSAAPAAPAGSAKPNPFAKKDGARFDLADPAKTVNKPDNDPSKSTGAQAEDDRVQEIMDKFTVLGGEEAIKVCLTWERIFGGAVCVLGVNDGQGDLTKPLDMTKVKSIDYLLPLEPREIFPVYGYTDPFAENYGKPEIYRATPRTIWPGKEGSTGSTMFEIHESRLMVFMGERVSRYQQVYAQNGWGMSIFVPMYRVLRDFNASWAAAGNIVTDFASAVYKFKDLWETLSGDDGAEFQARLASMNLSRSTINATVIDAEDEFERSSASVAGLPDLLNQFATRLAAACDMPLTLLFGTSPGGLNATGDSDIRFFYDRVAQYQRGRVLKPLKKLLEIIMLCTGDKKIPDKWDVDFRPLWQESAKDKAATMMSQSSADVAWITAGVLSAEEVAAGHWSTGKYQPDITVDFAAREKQEQAVAAPVKQADLDAINPDSPNYKGSQLDPNSSHYVEPPGGPAVPGAFGGAQPKQNPFSKMDANVARRQAYRAGSRPSDGGQTRNDVTKYDYSPDQERDEKGRFGSGGSIVESAKANGGFTVDSKTGKAPVSGYSVAIHGDREKKLVGKDAITSEAISNYIKDNHDVLLRDPQAHIGGWYNEKDDTWYLDVPHVESDISKAASLGADNKQLAIYDLKRGEQIDAHEYPDAVSKKGRFEGRTDARHGSSDDDPRGNGGSYEERARSDSRSEGSVGRLTESLGPNWSVQDSKLRVDYNPDQERDERGRFGSGSSSIGRAESQISGSRETPHSHAEPSAGLRAIAGHVGAAYKSTDPKQGSFDWKGRSATFQDSKTAYADESGRYDKDRQAIHDKFVADVTKGIPTSNVPTVYMTGGGPASGKTSSLLENPESGIPQDKGAGKAAYISADDAKERIPEFQKGKAAGDPGAAGFVHEESADMSKKAIEKAIKNKQDLIYDSTADSGIDKLAQKVQAMRDKGVKRVVAAYATVDVNTAKARSDARGREPGPDHGRFVPLDVLTKTHAEVSKTMIQAMHRGIFDEQKIFDTSVPKGAKPVLIASSTREGGIKVHNQGAWERLNARAEGK